MTGLRVAPDLVLPLDAVTSTFGILAVRRAGKSNAAVVLAEEMYAAGLPWVAIDPKGDWWGVRASGDGEAPGLSVLVFGGLHADVPLEPTAGQLVADLVVDQRLTCVLDVSEMTKADQRRFLTAFAQRLYKRNREPLHVFCEEADEYIPQMVRGEDAKLVAAFEHLVKRGGFRGIGVTLVTQRSASLNNNVLTQVETLIALRTTGTPDRKVIKDWVVYHAGGAEAVAELPTLGNGEAWVFSPSFLDVLQRVTFRRRATFDSGATPKVGQKPRPPAKLADVDVDAIAAAMADTIEKAKADDPRELRKRIADLERDLAAERSKPVPEPVEIKVEVPVLAPEIVDQLEALLEPAAALLGETQDTLLKHRMWAEQQLTAKTPLPSRTRPVAGRPPAPAVPVRSEKAAQGPAPAAGQGADPDVRLRSGAHRMVEALGRMHPLCLTKSQWGTVAKLKTSGGTWSTYLSDIRRAGLIIETAAGYTLSEAGFDYLGGQPDPMTAAELQDHYRTILRSGAVKMLDALIDAYPNVLTKDELGEAAAIATTGGTFSTYLSDLVRNGLAERTGGGSIVATEILMRGADQ